MTQSNPCRESGLIARSITSDRSPRSGPKSSFGPFHDSDKVFVPKSLVDSVSREPYLCPRLFLHSLSVTAQLPSTFLYVDWIYPKIEVVLLKLACRIVSVHVYGDSRLVHFNLSDTENPRRRVGVELFSSYGKVGPLISCYSHHHISTRSTHDQSTRCV